MIYKKLKQYAPERMGMAFLGVLLALAAAVFSVASYYYLYVFLERLIVESDIDAAVPVAVRIVLYLVASAVVYFWATWCTHVLGFRLETNLKKQGILHLMKASFGFYDRNESGRIRKILDDNTALTHTSVAHLIPDLTTAIFIPVLGIGLTFFIDWRIGILFTVSYVSAFAFIKKMMGEQDFMEQYMEAQDQMNGGAVEYVRGIHILKIFKTNVRSVRDFYRSVVNYSDLALKYSMSCRRWFVSFQVIYNAAFLIALFFSYIGNPDPGRSLAVFLFYVLFSGVMYVSLNKIMYVGMYVYQASSAIGKIEKLFDGMGEKKLAAGSIRTMDSCSVEFRNVTFGYTETKIVKNLFLRLEAGKTYALVGPSGSGKSTLAKLMSGFYSLDEGKIFIGAHDISEYTEEALAQNIANVFQEAKLFKRSIYENVQLGRRDAGYQEVMEALHLAQCDGILDKFEKREQTVIGAKGVHLSGGELQRIAIARAILKDAKIVIMDEASAAADPENEYELQRALSNLMKNKTVVMIAHRLTSIREVDEILVIRDGAVAERGSHDALMRQDSLYKRMLEEYAQANEWRVTA